MIKALKKVIGVHEFNRFTDFLIDFGWKIEKQLLKERVSRYNDMNMFIHLQEAFKKKEISIWQLKEEEIISWFDTLILLRRVMNNIANQLSELENLHIIIEYPLIFGNHMRTDYLIVFSRLIIVLEFGMFNQDEKRSEERYTKKLQESNSYRQILANVINQTIEVVNYVLIYRPEYDWYLNIELKDNIIYNYSETDRLCKFISQKLKNQNDLLAINQLEYIEKDR